MKLTEFLRTKSLNIFLTFLALIFIFFILNIYSIPKYAVMYITVIFLLSIIVPSAVEFFKKRQFYNNIQSILDELDKAYFLSEMIEKPDFFEGDRFYETIKICNKSMCDKIAEYKIKTNDYQEYIEKWVHEIKTPIAACKLTAENRSDDSWEELSEDLDKIEKYVDQTLFYSRVSNAEKDYVIKKKSLNEIVSYSLKSNARALIKNGFSIKRESLDLVVMTDEKWTAFILDQIISNSIKYKKDNPEIRFYGKEKSNGILLKISDNGLGIAPEDVPRIFEKNFTGGNGRLNKKSTGFGLYLCKKLCDKIGISISAYSELGDKTEISLFFPKSRHIEM